MRQGYRVSLLPAVNLCQMSELSLVLLALGANSGDVSESTIGAAAFSFASLAVGSTYAIPSRTTSCFVRPSHGSKKMDLHDLDHAAFMSGSQREIQAHLSPRFFSWTASSLIEEIQREQPRAAVGNHRH